jgi:hypothetical protein
MADLKSSHIVLTDRNRTVTLRRSLFWDMPDGALHLKRNKRLILERVFSRGNIEEFRQINTCYTEQEIRETVLRIGTFDKKTIHFISRTYQIKPSEFKCYGRKQ